MPGPGKALLSVLDLIADKIALNRRRGLEVRGKEAIFVEITMGRTGFRLIRSRREPRTKLDQLVEALLRDETIDQAAITQILGPREMPDPPSIEIMGSDGAGVQHNQ